MFALQALHPTGTNWIVYFSVPVQKSSGRFTVVAANSRAVWTNGRSSSTAFSIHHNMIKILEDGLSTTINYIHGKELKTDGSYYVTLGNLLEGKDGCMVPM